jgi:hypothetical protein
LRFAPKGWRFLGLILALTAALITSGTTASRMDRSGLGVPGPVAAGHRPPVAAAPAAHPTALAPANVLFRATALALGFLGAQAILPTLPGPLSVPATARSPLFIWLAPSLVARSGPVVARQARPPRPAPGSPATASPATASPAAAIASPAAAIASPATASPATTSPAAARAARAVATPARPAAVSPTAPASPCASAIAAVEGRGLFPAAGFVVVCPGFALGHEGMTCMNVAGVCPGGREIVIHDPVPFVVANEFENSRIFSGSPARCHAIDCGGSAYGY